jgi:hypothetical protein
MEPQEARRRVAGRTSATDSRPGPACLSAVLDRQISRRAAVGSDELRQGVTSTFSTVRLNRMDLFFSTETTPRSVGEFGKPQTGNKIVCTWQGIEFSRKRSFFPPVVSMSAVSG